jgi:hypothetical protein
MSEQPRRRTELAAHAPEDHRPSALADALKRTAAALREAEVPSMLCGSMACWVRGGPEPLTRTWTSASSRPTRIVRWRRSRMSG